MVQLTTPGVFFVEEPLGAPLPQVLAPIPGIIGQSKKGPVEESVTISSLQDFVTKFGTRFTANPLLFETVRAYINNGGDIARIVRVVGSGSATASGTMLNSDLAPAAAAATGTETGPTFDLEAAPFLNLSVDGAAAVNIDLATGAANPRAVTLAEIETAIDAAGFGDIASVSGGTVIITSLTTGVTSTVVIGEEDLTPDQAAIIAGLAFAPGSINQGNYAVTITADGLGAGGMKATIDSDEFGADPIVALFDGTHFNLDVDIDGGGPVTVDITGNSGGSGSYALALLVANLNAALAGTPASIVTTAGRFEIQLQSPTDDTGTIAITPSAADDASTEWLGFATLGVTADAANGIEVDGAAGQRAPATALTATQMAININRRLFDSTAYSAYGSLDGATGMAVVNGVTTFVDLVNPVTTGVPSVLTLDGVGTGVSALFEAFGYAEGPGGPTVTGTEGAAQETMLGPAIPDAVTSTFTGTDGPDDAATVEPGRTSAEPGLCGNEIRFTTRLWKTFLLANLSTGATSAELVSVDDIQVGHRVRFTDGVTTVQVYVTSIDRALKEISFRALPAITTIDFSLGGNCVASSSSSATFDTTVATAALAAATTLDLVSAAEIVVGDLVWIQGDTTDMTLQVAAVLGNTIQVPALPDAVSAGAIVANVRFDFTVTDIPTGLSETITALSTESENTAFYFETKISAESRLVVITDDQAGIALPPLDDADKLPAPVEFVQLAGGLDGSTPTPAEVLGSDVAPKTGVFLFEGDSDIGLVAAPGFTSATTGRGLLDFAATELETFAILAAPVADTDLDDLLDYKDSLRIDEHYALYAPWVTVLDRTSPDGTQLIPPDGFVLGEMRALASTPWVAAANIPLIGALGLAEKLSDAQHGALNVQGVNVLRVRESGGVVIMGSRTGAPNSPSRYTTTRLSIDTFRRAIRIVADPFVLQPNRQSERDALAREIRGILLDAWQRGGLRPENDFNSAALVKIDNETTSEADVSNGIMRGVVAFRLTVPAEFIVLQLTNVQGEGITVDEAVGLL